MSRSSKIDAVESFRFLVSFDGLTRAGFYEVSSPKSSFSKNEYREGNAPENAQLFAGLMKTDDVTMSRGVTTNQDFYKWAAKVFDPSKLPGGLPAAGQGPDAYLFAGSEDYKKDITITLLHRNGQPVKQWVLYNAFPVSFKPGSDMKGLEDSEKSMEELVVAYESFVELKGSEISAPLAGFDQE